MKDPKTINIGRQEVSEKVYFVNNRGVKVRPIYQKDIKTQKRSYRLYPNGGNDKNNDLKLHCYLELAKYARKGVAIRCRLPDGSANNRSINSSDIKKLIVES